MDPNIRGKVRDRFRDRAHEILKEAGVDAPWPLGPAFRETLDKLLITPQLNKLLKL